MVQNLILIPKEDLLRLSCTIILLISNRFKKKRSANRSEKEKQKEKEKENEKGKRLHDPIF